MCYFTVMNILLKVTQIKGFQETFPTIALLRRTKHWNSVKPASTQAITKAHYVITKQLPSIS